MTTLLLIEDDEDDVFLFQDVIREVNPRLTLHHSRNGLEAIKFLNLSKPYKPRCIFTDLNMPIMSGFEFLKQLKTYANFKDIPVFVLSTANDTEMRKQSLDLGAMDFFTKPPTVEGIKNIIEDVMGRLQEH